MCIRDRLKPICKRYKRVLAFYLTIAAHPSRCIGFANYRNTGLKYILRDGRVIRNGLLTGADSMAAPDAVFGNCALYLRVFKPLAQRLHTPDALELHTALIAASAARLRRECNADLTVLVWPDFPQMIDALKNTSLQTLPLAAASRKSFNIYSCIILGSLCLFFSVAEIYFRLVSVEETNVSSHSMHLLSGAASVPDELLYIPDPLLGGALKKGPVQGAHRRVYGSQEKLAYDVVYSVNEQSRRITPERGKEADSAVLLFGCSFTFGIGVRDEETYAWKLAQALGEKYQVINLGVPSYGAHQLLALILSLIHI